MGIRMKKTLKSKISLVYIGLVVLIAIVAASAVINLHALETSVNLLMTDNYISIDAASNMMEAIDKQDIALLNFIYQDKQRGIELFSEANVSFLKWFDAESKNITETGEKEIVDKINSSYKKYTGDFSKLQDINNRLGQNEALKYYNLSLTSDFNKTKDELKSLRLLNEEAMFSSKDEASKSARNYILFIILLSLVAVVGGYIVSMLFTNRLLDPLHRLSEVIKKVKGGDLNQKIDIKTKDETGELANEFNNMINRLHNYEISTVGIMMEEKNKSIAIVKSIADPLIALDMNYCITLLNDACERFFDISEAKATGKHFLEAIKNDELFEHISGMTESKEIRREKIIKITNDKNYYFNVVITKVTNSDKKFSGMIILMKDVTELKELERVKTDFIATISHEFRTPLTSVMMGASMLIDGSMGQLSKEQCDIIKTLKEDGERLNSLVDELLELSRLESGRAVFNMDRCSINAIVENSVKHYIEQADSTEVNLIDELDEDLHLVYADYEKISWVMNNLLGNALKYTDAGDSIIIDAVVRGNKMQVSVKDTGIGIPSEYVERIFDRFVQVKGREIEVRGTGIGLSVVKEIVEAHGGTIWCESKLDEGSNFTFTLPLYKEN